jgi:hypothetical protein
METGFVAWASLAMDTLEVGGLCVTLLLLLDMRRDMAALLRVMRRMDRKTADSAISAHRRQAELSEPRAQAIGTREAS